MAEVTLWRAGPRQRMEPSGLVAVVDDADLATVAPYRWTRRITPRSIYAWATMLETGSRTKVQMHTRLTGWSYVDHIDGDGLNNRRANLRESDARRNQANARSQAGTSIYKGVSIRLTGKWRAQITVNRVKRYLGEFDTEEDAARAYDEAAWAAWGEHARLNFPSPVRPIVPALRLTDT